MAPRRILRGVPGMFGIYADRLLFLRGGGGCTRQPMIAPVSVKSQVFEKICLQNSC